MPTARLNDIELYYEEKGRGTPIFFLHGFSLDHRMWNEQVAFLSSGYRVIAYDARGHGKSSAPETGYAREERAADLLKLADYLGCKKFHLVGLSMGGGDALSFAIDYQERLLTLILADTVASGYKPKTRFKDFASLVRIEGLENVRARYIETTLSYYVKRNPAISDRLAEMMAGFSGKVWTDPMYGNYPKRDDLRLAAMVRIPTLIIAGKNDISWVPLARKLHEVMLDSRLELIPGVGHMANMEAPDIFNDLLAGFLKQADSKNVESLRGPDG